MDITGDRMNDQIERIKRMEESLNRAQNVLDSLEQAWKDYLETAGDFSELEKYQADGTENKYINELLYFCPEVRL